MKIGIFGCTADPFTDAHVAIVSEILRPKDRTKAPFVDELIIAPTIVDYHRDGKKPWLSDDEKLDLIKTRLRNDSATAKLDNWSLWTEDFELRKMCVASEALHDKYVAGHRFIDTLTSIMAKRGVDGNEYYVVVGSDSWWNFKSWCMYKDIVKLAKVIVVAGRDGIDMPADRPPCIVAKIDPSLAGVSATKIRAEWRDRGYKAYKEYVMDKMLQAADDKTLFCTPILSVVQGAKTETGLKPIKISAPDWVTIIVEKDGKFLAETQLRYGSGVNTLEFPCGVVEHGEDAVDAACRELAEETGIALPNPLCMKFLGSVNPNPAFMMNTMHYFYVNLDSLEHYDIVDLKLDAHEKLTVEWMPRNVFINRVEMDAAAGAGPVPAMLLTALDLYKYHVEHGNITNHVAIA